MHSNGSTPAIRVQRTTQAMVSSRWGTPRADRPWARAKPLTRTTSLVVSCSSMAVRDELIGLSPRWMFRQGGTWGISSAPELYTTPMSVDAVTELAAEWPEGARCLGLYPSLSWHAARLRVPENIALSRLRALSVECLRMEHFTRLRLLL